jgi:hypothetical protein
MVTELTRPPQVFFASGTICSPPKLNSYRLCHSERSEESLQLVNSGTTEILRFAQNDMPKAFFQQPPKVSQPWVTEPPPGFLAGLFEPLNPAPIEPTVLPPG